MNVDTSHHIDGDGSLGFRYEYDLYRFSDGETTFVARSYSDSSAKAHFLRAELGGKHHMLSQTDLASPLFRQAAAYLREIGKTNLQWLSGGGEGYEELIVEI